MTRAEGFERQGLTLTVARAKEWESKAKTGLVEQTEFFALTTAAGLTGAYLVERGEKGFRECWGAVKQTWEAVTERMLLSLIRLYAG